MLRAGVLALVGLAGVSLALRATRTDDAAVFEEQTGVALPEASETVASCTEWGVHAAVMRIPPGAWAAFVRRLRAASPPRDAARTFNGLLCDEVAPAFGLGRETGTVSAGQNEGVVWVLDPAERLVLWEVWW